MWLCLSRQTPKWVNMDQQGLCPVSVSNNPSGKSVPCSTKRCQLKTLSDVASCSDPLPFWFSSVSFNQQAVFTFGTGSRLVQALNQLMEQRSGRTFLVRSSDSMSPNAWLPFWLAFHPRRGSRIQNPSASQKIRAALWCPLFETTHRAGPLNPKNVCHQFV